MKRATDEVDVLTLGGEIRPYGGPATLNQIFQQQVRRTPDNTALEDAHGNRSLSYSELDNCATELAVVLRQRYDVRPGKLVGLSAERSIETMISLLAVLKSGGAYVPLGERLPDARLRLMVDQISPAVILSGKDFADRLAAMRLGPLHVVSPMKPVSNRRSSSTRSAVEKDHPVGEDLAYLIFTSGTTGVPKGVMVPHRAVVRYIDSMATILQPTADDRVIQIMELTFDSSVFDIWMAWAFGATAVLCERWTALEGLGEYVRSRSITCLGCTPTQLGCMSPEEAPHLRIAAIGGEPVPPQLIRKWTQHPICKIYNQYGPTEAAVTVTSLLCTADMEHPKSIGYANPGSAKLFILDSDGLPVAPGVARELCIAGPQLAKGYFKQPELTAEKFISNPFATSAEVACIYRTGDHCRWLDDGSIEYIGRMDTQVKLRGFRIELAEIEASVLDRKNIRACAVVMRHRSDSTGTPFLCAYVVAEDPNVGIDVAGLRSHLTSVLPDHMVPAAYVELNAIPTDSSGKTDRGRLRPSEPEHFIVSDFYASEAKTPLQEDVACLFRDVLGIDAAEIGLHESFFSLGGQSLTAAKLLSLIRDRFNTRIRFTEFFAEPTLAYVATRVEQVSENEETEIALTSRDRAGQALPLSSAQSRMYYLHQLDTDAPIYNVCGIYDLRGGSIDRSRLEDAFCTVIQRHEILRSYYEQRPDGVYQIVRDEFSFSISEIEVGKVANDPLHQRCLEEATQSTSYEPFVLNHANALPLRASLIRLGAKHSRLVIVAHHIAMDGLSWDVFCTELSAAYAGRMLPRLPIQYFDFCLWESDFRRSKAHQNQMRYWREHLGDSIPWLRLPTDRPRPAERSGKGASLTRHLSGCATPLSRTADAQATTSFTVLLACYFGLLYRLSGQREIIVGILSPGRTRSGTDPLIGMFVNTLPIKIELAPETTISDLLQTVKQTITAAFDHQDVAFDDLVKQVVHNRVPGEMPLVQTMLTIDGYDDDEPSGLKLGGLNVQEIDGGETVTSMFDFSMGCSFGRQSDLIVEAEYATDLFDEVTVAQMLNQFETILQTAMRNPESSLTDIDLAGEFSAPPFSSDATPATALTTTRHEFVEPRTTEEVRLAAMFCDVLGLPRVGIDESFFALGGDSLLCFQLIARARQVGYFLNVSQVIELQTVQRLADFLLSAAALNPDIEPPGQNVEPGLVELIPIQRWFFAEQFPAPSHYNQSRIFCVRLDVDQRRMKDALLAVIQHHDALRYTYTIGSGNAKQYQHDAESAAQFLDFRYVDLSSIPPDELSDRIKQETQRSQSCLDVTAGPVVAATVIRRAPTLPPVLFLVVHHLMVDEVSWSILSDDLNLAYIQLLAEEEVKLPAKSHSFSQWSKALQTYSHSQILQNELAHWRHAESSSFRLPVTEALQDVRSEPTENAINCSLSVSGFNSATAGCPIRDVLVAALAWSMSEWTDGSQDVCVLLEGHGREDVVAKGIDLSRTVGWFTTVFPVRFELPAIDCAETVLATTLEQLRAIPNNGIGYGLLKYPFSKTTPLASQHASQITFNYLGRSDHRPEHREMGLDGVAPDLILAEEPELDCASDWNPHNRSEDSVLDVSCYQADDRIEMEWRFCADQLDCPSVQQLVHTYEEKLSALVAALAKEEGIPDKIQLSAIERRFASAISAVWKKHQQHDSFHGMAASIVYDGEFVSAVGHGSRDRARDVSVDEHTVFSLGSVGKPLVSLLSAVLADEGVVDLDEPLASTVSSLGLPTVFERMTLRHLFAMTAGIPDVDPAVEERVDDPFEICRSEIEIVHKPGTHYLYSNFSYALAGYFLALKAGHVDMADFRFEVLPSLFLKLLQEKVFVPVGMQDAKSEDWQFFARRDAKLRTDHQRGDIGSAVMLPSGAVKASVTDAARFLISEFNRGVSYSGKRFACAKRVAERFDVRQSLGYDWGMGWFFDRTHGFLHISGQWADSVSGLRLDPITGLGLSYVVSVRDSVHWQFLEMDMDQIFVELLRQLK